MEFKEKLDLLNHSYFNILKGPNSYNLKEFIAVTSLFVEKYESMAVMGYMSYALRIPGVKATLMTFSEWIVWARANRKYVSDLFVIGHFNEKDENGDLRSVEEVREFMDFKKIMIDNSFGLVKKYFKDEDGNMFKSMKTEIIVNNDRMVDINIKFVVEETNYITSFIVGEIPGKSEFQTVLLDIISGVIHIKTSDHKCCYRFTFDIEFEEGGLLCN